MRSSRFGRPMALLFTLAMLGALAACTGEDAEKPEADPPPAAEPAPLATTARMGVVTGRLGKPARAAVRDEVAAVVDGWIDGAFVGGDYPRSDFDSAYDGFTQGAAKLARRDGDLMSNAAIGEQIETVEATTRRVLVDVLATGRKATAATARVRLDFSTTGAAAGEQTVRGRLSLVRRGGEWRVFAYDVTRTPLPGTTAETTPAEDDPSSEETSDDQEGTR